MSIDSAAEHRRDRRKPAVVAGHRLLLGWLCLMLVDLGCAASAADRSLPDWYSRELSQLTQGTGRWIADNREYRSDDEAFDAYAVEWAMSPDQRGLTGRLYGLRDDREVAEFWRFRIYWDAKARQAVVLQFSGFGVIGSGNMSGFDQATLMDQTFTAPDGSQWRELHQAWFEDDTHLTRSFEWRDGGWVRKRAYRWSLAP